MYCTWNYCSYWAQSLIPYLILSQLCTFYTGMIDLFHCSILQPVYIRIGMYQPSFKLVQLCQIIPVRPLTYLIPRWSSGWTPAPHQLHRQPKRLTVQKRRRKLKLHRHVITLDVSNVFAFHFGLVDTRNRFGHTSTCMFAGPKIAQYWKMTWSAMEKYYLLNSPHKSAILKPQLVSLLWAKLLPVGGLTFSLQLCGS